MLHLFFIITFVAEIIVGYWIISKINECDKNINRLNSQVLELRPKIQASLVEVKTGVNKAMTEFASIVACIAEKREECKAFFGKNILSAIGSAVLKIPFKQIISIVETAITLKKIFRF